MSEENPYAAPSAPIGIEHEKTGLILASRGTRLGAALLDGLVYLVIFMPAMFVIGFEKFTDPEWANSLSTKLLFFVLGIPSFALNWYFVVQNGQTLGKKLVNIRMVRTDGSPLEAKRWFLRRVLPVSLASQIPFVGPWVSIVNAVFIFRKDRRCLHDHFADTMVVEA